MKHSIAQLNKAFESRIRLGVMSVLMVNDEIDFPSLKELLQVTDGNLASHTSALEKLEYIKVSKQFLGKKPNTTYAVTKTGRTAFNAHLDALENILKGRD